MRSTIHAVNRADASLDAGANSDTDELSIREASIRRIGRADARVQDDHRRHHVEGDSKMTRNRSNAMASYVPSALRPATLRAGLTLAVIAAIAAFAVRVQAEEVSAHASVAVTTADLRLATSQ
jgi:hypothetical protein